MDVSVLRSHVVSGKDCCGMERQKEAEVDEGRKEGEFTHSLSHARFLFPFSW